MSGRIAFSVKASERLRVSRVSMMVGTPAQWIDVFVSTASQETWVIGPGGCDGSEYPCLNSSGTPVSVIGKINVMRLITLTD